MCLVFKMNPLSTAEAVLRLTLIISKNKMVNIGLIVVCPFLFSYLGKGLYSNCYVYERDSI